MAGVWVHLTAVLLGAPSERSHFFISESELVKSVFHIFHDENIFFIY